MTQKLRNHIVTLLRTGLAGTPITTPATQVVSGKPTATPRPMIALYGGALKPGRKAGDYNAGDPRPQAMSEEFAIQPGNSTGPYSLAKTPLDGTALGKLVFDKDGPEERRQLVQEKKDFTIDYPNAAFTLKENPVGASHVVLEYSFAGIFFLQDFHQEIFLEVVGPDMTVIERLASLAASVIFTRHNEIIEQFNKTDRTVYSATEYGTEHWIGRLEWLDSVVEYTSTESIIRMRFGVSGQMKHLRQAAGGFGIIESVRSPGTPVGIGVNIVPQTG